MRVLVYTDKGTVQAEYRSGTVRIWAATDDGRKWKVVKEIEVADPDFFWDMSEDEIAHFIARRWVDSQLAQ